MEKIIQDAVEKEEWTNLKSKNLLKNINFFSIFKVFT